MRKINNAGLSLIKSFEGLRLAAYKDSVGVLTIGFGHTSMAGPPTVTAGLKISQHEAEGILARDLGKYESAVEKAVKVQLTDNQYAALVSLCYNIGPRAFASSTLVRLLNRGLYPEALKQFSRWNRAGGRVLPGLSRRRVAEAALFGSRSPPGHVDPIPPPPDIPAPRAVPNILETIRNSSPIAPPKPVPQGWFARFIAGIVDRLSGKA